MLQRARRLAMVGDKVIIFAYAGFDSEEARTYQPRVVIVDEKNRQGEGGVARKEAAAASETTQAREHGFAEAIR